MISRFFWGGRERGEVACLPGLLPVPPLCSQPQKQTHKIIKSKQNPKQDLSTHQLMVVGADFSSLEYLGRGETGQ